MSQGNKWNRYRKWCNFLVKRILWKKNGWKLAQRSPTNAHADVTKINKLKMFFMTNRKSLKYAPKEFSKVNAWCYKNTIFQTTQINYSRQPGVIGIVFLAVPFLFDLQTTVSCYNFNLDKDRVHARPELTYTVVIWYTNRCIHFNISAPNKEINFFIFCRTIINIVFSFINISTPTNGDLDAIWTRDSQREPNVTENVTMAWIDKKKKKKKKRKKRTMIWSRKAG